jgi:hypothetical protein
MGIIAIPLWGICACLVNILEKGDMKSKPVLLPIRDGDLDEVHRFLSENYNLPVTLKIWRETFDCKWMRNKPNNGFMYKVDNNTVGVLCALYSEQYESNRKQLICNLCTWFVLKEYRAYSLKLVAHILSQKDFMFTTLTLKPGYVKMHEAFHFSKYDNTRYLYIFHCSIFLSLNFQAKIYSKVSDMESILTPEALKISQDHAPLSIVKQLAVKVLHKSCLILYIVGSAQCMPYANIIYVSDPDLYSKYYLSIGKHLLNKEHAFYSRILAGHLNQMPSLSFRGKSEPPMMYRGEFLDGKCPKEVYSQVTLAASIASFQKDL